MIRCSMFVSAVVFALAGTSCSDDEGSEVADRYDNASFQQTGARVVMASELDSLVFEVTVADDVASTAPEPIGGVDGAPVLGYVFPTTLKSTDVGFAEVDGTVALAVTSHPDFDDTPLWDEDNNAAYDDDGKIYHSHWVVLNKDSRAPADLAVRQATSEEEIAALPPTSPMPMYLDSPGFAVVESGNTLRVVVPLNRVKRNVSFSYDAVTAYMEVDASGDSPLLAVHRVYDVISGDMSLPYLVEDAGEAPRSPFISQEDSDGTFDLVDASVVIHPDVGVATFSVSTKGVPAVLAPEPVGQVDGAPVLGYAFPTDISPAVAGFGDQKGTLTLAVTSHPDFDDTPLWDENIDGDYANDGGMYHVHWAVLVADTDSAGELSVPPTGDAATLPPTAPMPMYLDSPGYHAFVSDKTLRVIVPLLGIALPTDFQFDAVSTLMRVDASGDKPTLRVEEVYEVLSGDLSLPYSSEQGTILR